MQIYADRELVKVKKLYTENNYMSKRYPKKEAGKTSCKKALSGKTALCTAAGLFLIVAASVCAAAVYKMTLHVAFYGITEKTQAELSAQIRDVRRKRVKFITLKTDKPVPAGASWKYDMLFMENGRQAEKFAGRTVPPDEKVVSLIPSAAAQSCMSDGKRYALPLLIDDYEIAYYRTYRETAKLEIPQTFGELEPYLSSVRKYADFPLFCAGRDDETLSAFVSSMVEAQCGTQGYRRLVRLLGSGADFNECLSAELGKSEDGTPVSLASTLDIIRDWQNRGLIHPRWFEAGEIDVETFMGDHRLGAVFMSLSSRRRKPSQRLMYYDSGRFPVNPAVKDHALITRVTCGLLFRDTAENKYIFEKLLSADIQSRLSSISMLGPASARSQAHDRQADDARYYAASCTGGR